MRGLGEEVGIPCGCCVNGSRINVLDHSLLCTLWQQKLHGPFSQRVVYSIIGRRTRHVARCLLVSRACSENPGLKKETKTTNELMSRA